MPMVKVGRYDGEGKNVPDKFDPITCQILCRNCGAVPPRKNMCYCCEKCRLEWWRNNSPFAWGYIRQKALKRDGGKCVKCGKPASQVHHIIPVKINPKLEFELSNLESVCDEHHKHDGLFTKRAKAARMSKRLEDV
jgi:hypothetical protein